MEELIRELKRKKFLIDPKLEKVLLRVPIESFIPKQELSEFFSDQAVPFYSSEGFTKTVSAPSMICVMLQELELEEGMDVLVLGAKSGYIEALISEMVGNGFVYIIDSNQEICELTEENLLKEDYERSSTVLIRDPLKIYPDKGPWDRILITGQVPDVPRELKEQLADGGFILAPIGPEVKDPRRDFQEFMKIQRVGQRYVETPLGQVLFGPLDSSRVKEIRLYEPKKSHDELLTHFIEKVIDKKTREIMENQNRKADELKQFFMSGVPYERLRIKLITFFDSSFPEEERKEFVSYFVGPEEAEGKRSRVIQQLRPLPLLYFFSLVYQMYPCNGYRDYNRAKKKGAIKLSKENFGKEFVAKYLNVAKTSGRDIVDCSFKGYFNAGGNRHFTEKIFVQRGRKERICDLTDIGKKIVDIILKEYFMPYISPELSEDGKEDAIGRIRLDLERLANALKQQYRITEIPKYSL